MKQLLLLVLFTLLGQCICYSQTIYELDKDTAKYMNAPMFIFQISQLEVVKSTSMFYVSPMAIDSISVYKDAKTTEQYGLGAKNGVILIKLKQGTRLINLNQLYDKFNIRERGFPVYIDSAIAYHPKGIYLQSGYIKSAKIEAEKSTGEKYISLISGNPINRPKKGTIYIRGKT
ncbi:MAG TPA: hypothetical protein VK668_16690 [Mucilaginibacter sp.]|nr:hypothetical protein [Mucilaginibacter sp.]